MARDDYTPNNSVAPTTSAPSDYLNVRSNPAQFGAQVGQANQGLGKTVEGLGDKVMSSAILQQGMANEHAVNEAEMQLAIQGGQVYNDYKSLTGLDASNSKDKAINSYLQVNNKIRESLGNPAAQKAYDQLAARRMAFAIQDMNGYAANEQKKAYKDGRVASLNLSVDEASKYDVAANPQRFKYNLDSVVFDVNTLYTAPEYGKYQTVPAKTGKDGRLEFDQGTDQGKIAQADYDQYLNTAVGKIYSTATKTLYNDPVNGSIDKAVDFLNQNKDNMPAATYAELSHSLSGPFRQAQTRAVANQTFALLGHEYNNTISSGGDLSSVVANSFPGAKVTSTLRSPEHNAEVGGVSNSHHLQGDAIDFVPPPGTTLEQVKDVFTHLGYEPTEILDEKDHFHVAVKRSGSTLPGSQGYRNFSDYVSENYETILSKGEAEAERIHPGDEVFAQQTRQQLTQQLNSVIRDQSRVNTVNSHNVLDYINKNNVTNIAQIQSAPPEIKQAYDDLIAANPYYQQNMTNVITGKSFSKMSGYGPGFYKNFVKVVNGDVKNPADLGSEVRMSDGKNSPLSNTGFDILAGTLKRYQNDDGSLKPEGANFLKAEAQFLADARKRRVGPWTDEYQTNENFDKFIAQAVPQVEAAVAQGQKEGKSLPQIAHDLFTEKVDGKPNPNYVRTNVTAPDPVTLIKQRSGTFGFGGGGGTKYNDVNELTQAYLSGKITKDAARALIKQNHWTKPEGPKVPLPQ